jgi:hypothetical protein
MTRLFAVGGLFVDLAGSAVSLVGDSEQLGMPCWIGMNVILFATPLLMTLTEPLWGAVADAPDVFKLGD